LHSGHYGNWAPNPAARLAHLLASMRATDGTVLIKEFYDQVRPLSDLEKSLISDAPNNDAELLDSLQLATPEMQDSSLVERIMLPALNVLGLQSGGVAQDAKNAIMTSAVATLGFRLVPDMNPKNVILAVEDHIRTQGYYIVHEDPTPEIRSAHRLLVKLDWEIGYRAARTPVDLPICKRIISLLDNASEEQLVVLPSLGGSLPLYIFEEELGVPFIGLPIVNHDNNQHAPDENIRLQNLWDGIRQFAVIAACISGQE
jgi:acetylornithine deacetylase/succinyl-diaminopimelate desuccinylase-like protein